MGGKKKAGGDAKGKGKGADPEDHSVEDFWKVYRKKIIEYDCEKSKKM